MRKNIRRSVVRDVIDHLEYDVDPDIWINRLLKNIASGQYDPSSPRRYWLAKGKGFSRRITTPSVPDIVLYRAIVDWLYKKGKRREKKHVYFDRSQLNKAVVKAEEDGQQLIEYIGGLGEYSKSASTFLAWLHYNQYRKRLLLENIHDFIVTTDITNFFDTILHGRVAESLHRIAAQPRMVGLLFFILERLSIRDEFSAATGIGLAVDEFDCSRTLAHLVLLAHDERMVDIVGEDAYIRWADDQTFGVSTRAEGLRVLAAAGESLGRLNLTPNSSKSRVMTLAEARRHFHLDINEKLDNAFMLPNKTIAEKRALRKEALAVWIYAGQYANNGEWDKILSRTYRLFAKAGLRRLRTRAVSDIIHFPTQSARICDYIRCTGTPQEYLDFLDRLWSHPEQIYPDVNVVALEVCMRLEPDKPTAKKIRGLASSFLKGEKKIDGAAECAAIAPLLIMRFGDTRSLPLIQSLVNGNRLPPNRAVARATSVVLASYGKKYYRMVKGAASTLHRNDLAEVVRLVERISKYDETPDRYKRRLNLVWDDLAEKHHIDTRSVVAIRLLRLNNNKNIISYLKNMKNERINNAAISQFDKDLAKRLFP